MLLGLCQCHCLASAAPGRQTRSSATSRQEFLEKMEENRGNTVGRRAALLLQRLLVDLRRRHYKPTQGDNRGISHAATWVC